MISVAYPKPVIGVCELKGPILGVPSGAKVRVRMRNDSFAEVFVKHGAQMSHWILYQGADGVLELGMKQGENIKSNSYE
jgi:hypothetical protein